MSDWISVEDKLPEHGVLVLLADSGVAYGNSSGSMQGANLDVYRFGYLYKTAFDGDKWMIECRYTGSCYITKNVTHWTPLPEPPNAKEAPNSVIFHKEYDGESIADIYRDVYEAVDQRYNSKLDDIPVDEYGFQKGKFVVNIVWSE